MNTPFFNATPSKDIDLNVIGNIPEDLIGTLYRVGPGLFSRGAEKKSNFIEGDGLVHSITFASGKAILKQRFVETKEFLIENNYNKFSYRTINSKGTPFYRNFGTKLKNLSNINILRLEERLLTFDEMQKPIYLNPESLATFGEANWPLPVMAHYKYCPFSKKYYILSCKFFPGTSVKVGEIENSGEVNFKGKIKLPPTAYFHDWLLTENYYLFVIPPVRFRLTQTAKMIFGLAVHQNCLEFKNNDRTHIVAISRSDPTIRHTIEADPFWFWHTVSATEKNSEIRFDLIVSPFNLNPSDLKTPNSNQLVNFVWNLSDKKLTSRNLHSSPMIDFPCVPDSIKEQFYFWFLSSSGKNLLDKLVYLDRSTYESSEKVFGDETLMSPVLANCGSNQYLLVESYNYLIHQSCIYVLTANSKMEMLAKIVFSTPIPFSFHGCWYSTITL